MLSAGTAHPEAERACPPSRSLPVAVAHEADPLAEALIGRHVRRRETLPPAELRAVGGSYGWAQRGLRARLWWE